MGIGKKEKIIIICILTSIFGVLALHLFYMSCINVDGEFDNSIFWSAISTIVSILGFGGAIYTLVVNEKTRIAQNDYEYNKDILMNEQENFRRACFEQIENINPGKLIYSAKIFKNHKDKKKLLDIIYGYQMCMNEFPGIIRFYYKYKNETYQQFERYFGYYAIKSWNIINKIIDGKGKTDEIEMFRDTDYESLKNQMMILIDCRQKYIEEELKCICDNIKK